MQKIAGKSDESSYRICKSVLLLSLPLILSLFDHVDGAVFVPSRRNHEPSITLSAATAARAMNSIAFLSELVSLKDTDDVKYYTEPAGLARGEGWDGAQQTTATDFLSSKIRGGTKHHSALLSADDECSRGDVELALTGGGPRLEGNGPNSFSTSCEYVGKLWFLRKKGIKFREQVRVLDVSPDGKSARVECLTHYHNGNKWVDCSRVTCKLSSVTLASTDIGRGSGVISNGDGVEITVESKLLVRIPLPGLAGKAVRSKIGSSFESAAEAFFEKFVGDYIN